MANLNKIRNSYFKTLGEIDRLVKKTNDKFIVQLATSKQNLLKITLRMGKLKRV